MLFEWVTVKGQFSCSSFSVPAMVKTEETPWCLVSRMSSTQMTLSPAFLSPRRCPPVKISLWPVTRRRQYQQPPPSHRTQTWTVNLTWKREWLNPSKLQRAVSIPKMHLVEIKLEYVAYSEIGSGSVLDCQDTGYNAWRQGAHSIWKWWAPFCYCFRVEPHVSETVYSSVQQEHAFSVAIVATFSLRWVKK